MTRADTIARLVNAYTDAIALVVGSAIDISVSKDNLDRGEARREGREALEASRQHLHLAFLECLGGAAVAGEAAGVHYAREPFRAACGADAANQRTVADPAKAACSACEKAAGPWVVRVEGTAGHGWRRLDGIDGPDAICPACAADLTSLEALRNGDEYPNVRLRPEPPKPAGWVVRHSGGVVRWLCIRTREGAWPKHEPFATREDAQRMADTTAGEVLPVDAAGNVIEAAGEPEATDRAWLRADRDAFKAEAEALKYERDALREHLGSARTELAAVKAERERLRADIVSAEAERADLRGQRRTLRQAMRTIATTVGAAVSPEASTEMHCAVADEVRAVVEKLRAEVQRSREQKPVRWLMIGPGGEQYGMTAEPTLHPGDVSRGWTVAPLYLAPVVRDHSGVIAQCEEALRLPNCRGGADERDDAILAALAALRGAS